MCNGIHICVKPKSNLNDSHEIRTLTNFTKCSLIQTVLWHPFNELTKYILWIPFNEIHKV
uniref:Uncharacterized protein n=1 Tax=Helianthus annuus TaxID=4232 RepID=A0A251VDM1_HELAN